MEKNLFKKVIVGFAFSPNLRANIFESTRLAKNFNAKLFFIHVGEKTDKKEKTFNEIIKSSSVSPNNIEILSTGGGNKTGHILLGADGKIHGFSDDIKWQAGDSIALQGDGSISSITTGKVETVAGSTVDREAEGVDVGLPGGGAETALEWADTMARTLKSLF